MIARLRLVLIIVAACGASVLFTAALPDSILAGDSLDYRNRMIEMFSGKIPYIGFPFEHLPVMILPLAAAWLLGGSADLNTYTFALAGVSTVIVLVTGLTLRRLEQLMNSPGMTTRWLLLVTPLLPFLLFRNDSLVVLLAVWGVLLARQGRGGASLLVLGAGTLAKGWPALWAAGEWWRRRRRAATILVLLGLAAVAIQQSPAVQAILDPKGIHSETLTGAGVGLMRAVQGTDLRLLGSASVYVEAPAGLLLVHVLVGGAIGGFSLLGLRRPFTWTGAWRLMGALVTALILASPFFSTQYVAWVSPFAAIERRATAGMLAVNVFSLILITTWHQLFDGPPWWWGLLVVRNLTLIWVGVRLARVSDVEEATSPADHVLLGG